MSHFLYALLVKKKARAFFLLKEWILHVKKTRPSLFLSERIISVRKFYPFLINFTNGKDFLTEKVLESFRMRINARKCPINWNWLEKMPNFSVCCLGCHELSIRLIIHDSDFHSFLRGFCTATQDYKAGFGTWNRTRLSWSQRVWAFKMVYATFVPLVLFQVPMIFFPNLFRFHIRLGS